MGSGLLAPRDGSADCTLVVTKLPGYLSLGYTRIMLDEDGSPFCPGQIMRCVHGQNIKIQALLSLLRWVFISRRQTIHWELITIPKSQLKLSKFHMNRHVCTARRQNVFCQSYVAIMLPGYITSKSVILWEYDYGPLFVIYLAFVIRNFKIIHAIFSKKYTSVQLYYHVLTT